MCNKDLSKDALIDLILRAGLVQDFIEWLKRKNIELYGLKGLEELDYSVVFEYAKEKRLVVLEEDIFEGSDKIEEKYEPLNIRPKTPPKKK